MELKDRLCVKKERGEMREAGEEGRGERRTETAVQPAKVQGRYRMKKSQSKFVKTTSAG